MELCEFGCKDIVFKLQTMLRDIEDREVKSDCSGPANVYSRHYSKLSPSFTATTARRTRRLLESWSHSSGAPTSDYKYSFEC